MVTGVGLSMAVGSCSSDFIQFKPKVQPIMMQKQRVFILELTQIPPAAAAAVTGAEQERPKVGREGGL